MKTGIACAVAGLIAITGANASLEEGPAERAAAELALIKSLEGEWAGPDDNSDGEPDFTCIYRATAGGHAMELVQFPGTPMEMSSLFYIAGDTLEMTHYCAIGNRPVLRSTESDAKNTVVLSYTDAPGIDESKDHFIAKAEITLVDDDHLVETWSSKSGGEWMEGMTFDMRRVKSASDRVSEKLAKGEAPAAEDMEKLVFVHLKPGPNRDHPREVAMELQKGHLANLDALAKKGVLLVAGPFGDDLGGGLCIMRAESVDAARELMSKDPAVAAGRLEVVARPWWTAKGVFSADSERTEGLSSAR